MNLVIDSCYPSDRDIVVLAGLVLFQLYGVHSFEMVDDTKLVIVTADNWSIWLDLVCAYHTSARCNQRADLGARPYPPRRDSIATK